MSLITYLNPAVIKDNSIEGIKIKDGSITSTKIDSSVSSGGDAVTTLVQSITWSDLKAKRDAGELTPGMQYRITDYQCTTTTEGTKSAGHAFDIIATADDESTLNEVARAIKHDGDTYFANNDLNAWQIWYCLDNDNTRFGWADSTNGKGVIYRMIDEFNNGVPYDFKNIQFYRQWNSNTSLWSTVSYNNTGVPCYTFSSVGDSSTTEFMDMSLDATNNKVYFNVIKEYKNDSYKQTLNNNCFFGTYCYCNTFENDCEYNSFGNYCSNNIFGNDCDNNSFGESCSNNIFGNDCDNNTFGDGCANNTFGNRCQYIKFVSDDSDTATKYQYYQYNHFGDGCQRILFIGKETASPSTQVQNYNFSQGINCGNTSYTDVFAKRNLPYETRVLAPGATTQEIR